MSATHGLATNPPWVLAPITWFHDPLALANPRGTIVAMGSGPTPAGIAMVGVTEFGLDAYRDHVASGVATSEEGEAMVLVSYVRRLAA